MKQTLAIMILKGVLWLVLAIFDLMLIPTQPTFAQTQTMANTQVKAKTELKVLDNSLEYSKKELKQNKFKREKILSKIESIEKQITDRSIRLEQTQNKLAIINAQTLAIKAETDKLKSEFANAQSRLASLLESNYLMGQQNGLKVALSQSGTQHLARMNYYTRLIAIARQNQMATLQDLQTSIDGRSRTIDTQRKQINTLSTVLQDDTRYLGQLKQNRLAMIKDLDIAIDTGTHEVALLRQRKARLEALLLKIAKRQEARNTELKKTSLRAKSTQKQRGKASLHKTVVSAGSLPMPVKAHIVARFGDKRANSGLPWSGMLLQANEGSNIRAISDGEIVFADWLQGYGQMVILDHGNGLMSLYGHNKRIFKGIGDHVSQSDIIAAMGGTAGLADAALYFEIRKNGKAEDPLKWCRI